MLSLVDRVEAHVIVQILETFGHGLRREVQTIAALGQLLHQIPGEVKLINYYEGALII